MDDDEDMNDAPSAPSSSASDERANLAAFMLGRQQIHDDGEDDEEEAEVLAAAAAARKQRRQAERESGRAISHLVDRAQQLTANNQLMDAVGLYTEALNTCARPAVLPRGAVAARRDWRAARGGRCGRGRVAGWGARRAAGRMHRVAAA